MRVTLIMGQYPVQYEGELMPNVLAAWDEYILDDNYEGFEKELARYEDWVRKGDLSAVRVIVIELPADAVLNVFQPPTIPVRIIDA